MERVKVLCVDDESHILKGLELHLRRTCKVVTALSGEEGLKVIAEQGPFAVVMSDMRMPGMDGAAFLSKVREAEPDATRMLLTGHADLGAAISAVNDGQIFRFLTKPCPPDKMRLAFEAAIEQNRLLSVEKVLLEQTLHGSIKTLTDILSLTNPVAFGRATRIKKQVSEIAETLKMTNRWQVEVAAMLSQLGSVSLPEETAERYYKGRDLNDQEKAMVARMPKVTEGLLGNIPRLEPVREILTKQSQSFQADDEKAKIPLGARVLKVATEFDELEARGLSPEHAISTMLGREGTYDPDVLQAFVEANGASAEQRVIKEVPLHEVRVGMVFAEDVHLKTGLLLVGRGFEVTRSFMEKMRNYKAGTVREPLRVILPARKKDKEPCPA